MNSRMTESLRSESNALALSSHGIIFSRDEVYIYRGVPLYIYGVYPYIYIYTGIPLYIYMGVYPYIYTYVGVYPLYIGGIPLYVYRWGIPPMYI